MRQSLQNKTVLVTGGAGFIGSHLVDQLITQDVNEIIVVDNMFLGNNENLTDAKQNGTITTYNDDASIATSLQYIFDRHKIDIVFNCATKALNYSFLNPENAFSVNVAITLNLLELQRAKKFNTLCHFSTSEVYGSAVYEPMDESHPKLPTTTYAAGKAAADLAVESYVKMFNLDSFIVRPFNNYGPRQNYKGFMAGVIPNTARRILQNERPELHGSGKQTRDFIYVKDTIKAIIDIYYVLPRGESVNISSENNFEIQFIIKKIMQYFQYEGEILLKDKRYADVFTHKACDKKLKGLITFKETPLEIGLENSLSWYEKKIKRIHGR